MKKLLLVFFPVLFIMSLNAQEVKYPYPVHYLRVSAEQATHRMAYMDVSPAKPNGKVVMLLHGKNFNGYYWKDVISFLSDAGFRVVIPDQLGFGLSDKPAIAYSLHLLAASTKKLLDTLGIPSVNIISHSMGGMLASRFVLMYPASVDKLVYENPIGLEDYKTFVPYRSFDEQLAQELRSDFASLKKYQQTYYPEWKQEYDQYVQAQLQVQQVPDRKQAAWASAATYEMIYEQPVIYELDSIRTETLLLIGQADRTVVGKNLLSPEQAKGHGNYPVLGKMLQGRIRNSRLVELDGVGHIPHIQQLAAFRKEVLRFL
ncbi:MAG: alpha/beta hydrolase [Chitinophagaceae bacterium]|nr:MAG: alpha/beta hydrolase [Chitinophagaceae bacterium]